MTKETLLDRAIAYLSPERGAHRLAARRAIEALSYEGARRGRREDGWLTGSLSADAEIAGARVTLRNRVRSLMRDNAYAVKGLQTLVVNRIGTGITVAADTPNKRTNEQLTNRWRAFVDRCDATGRTDFYGLQALAERCRVESGEAFIQIIPTKRVDADDVGFRLYVLEPDYLDTTRNEKLGDGNVIVQGIEYEGKKPVAYWIFAEHPGDSSVVRPHTLKSARVPSRNMLHYFRQTRPNQTSGVTEFAPVIRRLYDLDGYGDAELMRKKIAACSVAWVTTASGLPASGSLGPTTTDSDRTLESMAPGMIHYGRPGEQATFFDPKPSDGFAEYFDVELHAIASGLNIPYELLTADFSKVNYTSFRAALVQFKAMIEADQWQLVIPQICQPIWDRFINFETAEPGLKAKAKFTPPRFGLLDPAKEIPAMVEAIQGGLRTWSDTIRREGYEPDEVLEEIKREREEFKKAGVSVSSLENPDKPEPKPKAAAPASNDNQPPAGEPKAA